MDTIEILSRRLLREKAARKEAENILEQKSSELYKANEELRTIANSLASKEENTRVILETTADAIIAVTEENKIAIANTSACELFGYTAAELSNERIEKLLGESEEALQRIFSRVEKNVFYELKAIKKSGMVIPVEIAISRARIHTNYYTIFAIRDIYDRKQAELYLALQHTITKYLAESNAFEVVITSILREICLVLNAEVGIVWMVDPNEDVLKVRKHWNNEKDNAVEFVQQSIDWKFKKGEGLPGLAWQKQEMQIIKETTTSPLYPRRKLAQAANLHTAIVLPLIFEKNVVAVIELLFVSSQQFHDAMLKILVDISHQLAMFIEKENSNKKLLEARRLSGMAEVATNVLHNVGNVLNSVNVSVTLLQEKINNTEVNGLLRIQKMLENPQESLALLLNSDERGRVLAQYLIKLASTWQVEQETKLQEIGLLIDNIQHINTIIKSQQTLSGTFGAIEPIDIRNLINEALSIHVFNLNKENINVTVTCDVNELVLADRVKILQIIVNLIKNAYDSTLLENPQQKLIDVTVKKINTRLLLSIKDNGVGIADENFIKIFNHGFTTKKDGHGFGLHASAIAAHEMGGNLTAKSPGLHQGAEFTLELPYKILSTQGEAT